MVGAVDLNNNHMGDSDPQKVRVPCSMSWSSLGIGRDSFPCPGVSGSLPPDGGKGGLHRGGPHPLRQGSTQGTDDSQRALVYTGHTSNSFTVQVSPEEGANVEESPKTGSGGAFFTCSDLRGKSALHKAARVKELKLALKNLPAESTGRLAARRRTLQHSIKILAK